MGRYDQPAERGHGRPAVPRGRDQQLAASSLAAPAPAPGKTAGPVGLDAIAHLQRTAGNAAVGSLLDESDAAPDAVLAEPGRSLDTDLRGEMEASLGADFSTVRVHDGGSASTSARALGARAYTVGEDIVLGDGGADRGTIAHELAHVIQQRSGPVAGTPMAGGFSLSDPGDPFERAASATAAAIVSGSGRDAQALLQGAGRGATGARAAQRQSLSDASSGGSSTGPAQDAGVPNPVVAAMWQYAVQGPLRTARNELSNEKPDHHAAYEALRQASDGLEAAIGALQSGDPRLVKANYLLDDLRLIRLWLAPRANVEVGGTDDDAASKVGGMEYDAQVVGESLGGNPAPRQIVNPALGSGE